MVSEVFSKEPIETIMVPHTRGLLISVMLAVPDAPAAVAWCKRAPGATELWSLGSVAGLELAGAPFFVGEPEANGWESPSVLGTTSTRVEVFCEDPTRSLLGRCRREPIGMDRSGTPDASIHRQGGFSHPFGHIWLVGDRSPLGRFA